MTALAIATAAYLVALLFALALCRAAAHGDRMLVEELDA